MPRSPLRRREAGPKKGRLRFDGQSIECAPGENLVAALWAAGVFMTSRSAKYRRPRGAFCLRGDCGTCLVRVDGRPNRRACTELALLPGGLPGQPQREVESQNKKRPDMLDPTRLVDAAFRKGMDHHHLMVHPRAVNQVMQTVARELTGFGHLPDAQATADALAAAELVPSPHQTQVLDVLIVGAGAAGRAVAQRMQAEGANVALVDRRSRHALAHNPLWLRPRELPSCFAQVGMFAAYPGEQLWAGNVEPGTGPSDGSKTGPHPTPGLRTFAARHVVLAPGARDTMIPFANNDRPGVVAARGLAEMLASAQLECAPNSVVVVGDGAYAHTLAELLHAQRVDPGDVVNVLGSERVRGLQTRSRKIECQLVALAATPAPAHELAVMAGARTEFDGNGFAVQRDGEGVCAQMHGPHGECTVWAAGDVCGYLGPDKAFEDGRRVADNLARRLNGKDQDQHQHQAQDQGGGDDGQA